MERVDVRTLVVAAVLTIIIFAVIYSTNIFLEGEREKTIKVKMDEILEDFEEIETVSYLMSLLSEKNDTQTCFVLKSELEYLESKLWSLDSRIKEYMQISREFTSDEFYRREKRKLNRREIIQLSLLEKMRKICGYNQTVILYFYGECEKNKKCEQQGFVLTYINNLIDPEIAIFSFDADLNISSVNALIKLYNVTDFPCVVIEGHTHCGLHDRDEMMDLLCRYSRLSICANKKHEEND